MNENLTLSVISGDQFAGEGRTAVIDLCSHAYGKDYAPYMQSFADSKHVVACLDGKLVSHAVWITRWLQIGDGLMLRTAYVEAVATVDGLRGRGLATAVMERLAIEIAEYEIGALSPANTSLYARLGWEFWQGPLRHRKAGKLISDPDEQVMILRLRKTPDLDLSLPLSVEWRAGEIW